MGNSILSFSTCLLLAGTDVPISVRHSDTIRFFGGFISDTNNWKGGVFVPKAEWEDWISRGGTDDGRGEYTCLTAAISDFLLDRDRCVIHAGAFQHKGKAWLLAGPSGAGKTTQIGMLRQLEPAGFGVICGDRPILQLLDGEAVFVHPSPWNGKENWKGEPGAELAGIIILQRDEENAFYETEPKEAVLPVLNALIHTAETEEIIQKLAQFEDALLTRVPAYLLRSHDVPDSTYLLYKNLFKEK